MSQSVIQVSNLSKSYRLGAIGSRTLSEDLNRWWARLRKQPDPYLRIGQEHLAERMGERIWALKDINFEVQQGEALGIIGRNGAGKSTLLKILSRITAPTTGEIRIKGRIASLLEVGTGFHPELTGRENIFLNGAILGMKKPETERKFDEIVDFAGVEKFIDTPVKRYSSGMYVRLAFAVAAHLDPEILVVDEVLAVGDIEFQKKCLGKMGEVAGEGRTVLFVSHNMAAIQSLCKNCILLDSGKIYASGLTENIISSYISSSIMSLFHESRLNGFVNGIRILNKNRDYCSSLLTGESFIIQLHIDTKGELINNPTIGIGINNISGTRLFTLGTFLSKTPITRLFGKEIIECHVNDNFLVPGTYNLKISIVRNMVENIEEIENAFQITIHESDFFGNGKLPKKNQGFFLVKSEWKILDENLQKRDTS